MTRLEELTLKLADEALTNSEARELESLLSAEPQAAAAHIRLLEVEAALRGQREGLNLAEPTLARLCSELAVSVKRGVMQRLESEPPPVWARARGSASPRLRAGNRGRFAELLPRCVVLPRLSRPPVLAFAVSLVLLVSLIIWYFGPTMGRPMLADVQGVTVSLKRGEEFLPAANGTTLQPADVLHVGTNASAAITFGAERTRLELRGGTELKLTSLAAGKCFTLQTGRLEAVVARQRPFYPMVFTSPQAEARVLGTKFTLTATAIETRLEVAEGQVKLTRKSDDVAVKVHMGHYAVVAAEYKLAAQPITGKILCEYWTNLPGDYYITYLTAHRDFPEHPSGREYLAKFESPSHLGTNYGARLCGYLHPPKTGDYTFWVATSDGAAFFLSEDDQPENKQQLAYAKPTSPHEWTRRPGQQSAAVPLVAGRKYYVEALQKQGAKPADHLAVAWQGPSREREVIPGKFLSPFEPKTQSRK